MPGVRNQAAREVLARTTGDRKHEGELDSSRGPGGSLQAATSVSPAGPVTQSVATRDTRHATRDTGHGTCDTRRRRELPDTYASCGRKPAHNFQPCLTETHRHPKH